MPPQSLAMLIAPGTTALGREICRLGRAAGHEMTSLGADGRPASDEAWLHGVAWSAGDPTDTADLASAAEGASVVVLLPEGGDADRAPAVTGDRLRQLLGQWDDAGVDRVVYVTTGHGAESDSLNADEQLVVGADGDEAFAGGRVALQLPTVEKEAPVVEEADGRDRRCPPIPVGQAAMAVLRAAAEPDHTGTIACDEATELGYAVMIQG